MPEGTRQSLCCSQPEHGPTLSHQMSQERKKHMAWLGLEPRTSRIPCEHSDHWVTEPHGRPVIISPCLIGFVPESARNNAGTDETVSLLLAAKARPHTGHQMSQGRKKVHGPIGDSNPGPLAYPASTVTTERPSHTVDLWQWCIQHSEYYKQFIDNKLLFCQFLASNIKIALTILLTQNSHRMLMHQS